MANEAQRINNPDLTPGAVSTGYQLQNTGMVAARVGMDASVVTGGTGECVLEISGPVDVNGENYTINSQVTFTLTTAGKYYIHLAGSGLNLTPTIGTGANTFDPDKNARYTDTGSYRVLNWVIYYDGTTAYVHRLVNPVNDYNDYKDIGSPGEFWLTTNGSWSPYKSGWYTFFITAKGGTAIHDTGAANIRGSGGSSATGIKRLFVNYGDVWTASFSSAENGNLTFSDGSTTFTVNNADNNIPGDDPSGFDYFISGSRGLATYIAGTNFSGTFFAQGANSYYGGGGGGFEGSSGFVGNPASGYGSGGGYGAFSRGAGKQGVIRIVG